MALSIKSKEVDRLARELAALRGTTLTEAIETALREELRRERGDAPSDKAGLAERLMEIARHAASLPVLDNRSVDEILGYDENGLPT